MSSIEETWKRMELVKLLAPCLPVATNMVYVYSMTRCTLLACHQFYLEGLDLVCPQCRDKDTYMYVQEDTMAPMCSECIQQVVEKMESQEK